MYLPFLNFFFFPLRFFFSGFRLDVNGLKCSLLPLSVSMSHNSLSICESEAVLALPLSDTHTPSPFDGHFPGSCHMILCVAAYSLLEKISSLLLRTAHPFCLTHFLHAGGFMLIRPLLFYFLLSIGGKKTSI